MRLGALELLANISSGRLSTTDKDPFPHQLALQQYMRKPPRHDGLRRLLVADEVGLGKTIEAGLILRDILLSRGKLEGFCCLYLTSGGLVEDAADKLRDVLSGVIDGNRIVDTVPSLRRFGTGTTIGVHVASTHAARLYVTDKKKQQLPSGVRPDVIIVDECHHAASDSELAGAELSRSTATQTYIAVKQLLSGDYWLESAPPRLAILMSATPFRSKPQFVNLLRLLTHGVARVGEEAFDAYDHHVQSQILKEKLQDEGTPANVVWRRQSDEHVRAWSGNRLFPNLTVVRPHQVSADDPATPKLPHPSKEFLELLATVKSSVAAISKMNGQRFGGFAIAQLEKKLTSSSIAGACWLFSWAVRHCQWDTQEDFKNDQGEGTEALRRLIVAISRRIASYNPSSTTDHATVRFPSDGFEFPAKSLAQGGVIRDIQKYSKQMREDAREASKWVADQDDLVLLTHLATRLLALGQKDDDAGIEDAKLAWLNELLARHPNDRFILFTESLQTCEAISSALGSACRLLVGSMSKAARNSAVADLRNPKSNARVLVATSAADEGFDLQVASKVVHWDLSPSPAVLMQRNGRVARLGQVTDVTAYYLILSGTHEQRRDTALQAKFGELGIDDEALKSRILGSLTEEEEARLEEAIENNEEGVVGDILKKASDDNDKMDQELADIRTNLEHAQVLSREDLADRLDAWQSLGLPDAVREIQFKFDTQDWERPVFGEDETRLEKAESRIARVACKKYSHDLVFDPEFLVFGPRDAGDQYSLAGLPPWIHDVTRHGRHCVVPYTEGDLLGRLLQGLARLRRADFLSLPRQAVALPAAYEEVKWLLFCTHPLREDENVHEPKPRPFLTFYGFKPASPEEPMTPVCEEGADASEVHEFLKAAERHALGGGLGDLEDTAEITKAKQVGKSLQKWLESVTKFGATSFLEAEKYLVPIPVALVRLA